MPESAVPAERTVVVVGGGFRGTSVLERLVANLEEFRPSGGRLRLVSVDEYPPGPGRIWRTDQSADLLMNTPASAFTVWPDASVSSEGPKAAGPSLWEWLRRVADALAARETADGGTPDAGLPTDGTGRPVLGRALAADLARRPVLAASVRAATADTCTPRVLLGHYLTWCHETVTGSLPRGVRHDWWRDRVTDVERTGGRYRLTLAGGAAPLLADAVVLCTGWSTPARAHRAAGDHEKPAGPGKPVRRLRGDNASDQDLSAARPGADVVVEGLGLSFFDVTTLLTAGRGGRFVPDDTAPYGLRYEPSGREPVLHATSRQGVPYWCRPGTDVPDGAGRHRFLTGALRGRPRPGRFDGLGPAIARDTLGDYYTHLATVDPDAFAFPLTGLLDALASLPPDSDAWREAVADAVPDPDLRLDLDGDAALAARDWTDQAGFEAAIRGRLLLDLAETAKGAASSLKVAHRSFGKARKLLFGAVQDGGLTAESWFGEYADFVDLAFRLNNGPPPVRLRELLALHDAGVVRFLGPRATPGERPGSGGHPWWSSAAVPGTGVRSDLVIEARVPAPSLHAGTDPLLRALSGRGLAESFHLDSADGPVPTAAPRADPLTGLLHEPTGAQDPDGPGPRLYALGVLMRDTRVSSLAAPAPNTDAVALRESDRTARSVLAGIWDGRPDDVVPLSPGTAAGHRTTTSEVRA
ncbi:FAD/NAD(P)-binding protein [Streptomyces sp. NBC_00102]|uniref:FAD/NAD(P)-binding protein n=1 Tax=Streptomyces sp. NBC_00102 TaxID=2975652 RepID=UPI00225B329A|nr:FAD/NAD(P)-binding protein [Streptomyces sp. NBC_00102]MCX5396675.1 FAD/NAD(P)-binding protein [Streptomyces sp. NBC_00102]